LTTTGNGFTVQEVIDCASSVTEREITVVPGDKRVGDSAQLVADSKRAKEILGWMPQYPDLQTIIKHAWKFEQKISHSLKN